MPRKPASPLNQILPLLKQDLLALETLAYTTKAFRRPGKFKDFSTFLHFLCAWGLEAFSLREASLWLEWMGMASISPPSLQERIPKTKAFLQALVQQEFSRRKLHPPKTALRLLLLDATAIHPQGSGQTYWLLHTLYDPIANQIQNLHVTSSAEGERVQYQSLQPGDVVVADRGYSKPASVCHVQQAHAHAVIRLRHSEGGLFVQGEDGSRTAQTPGQWAASLNTPRMKEVDVPAHWKGRTQSVQGRLIGLRLSLEKEQHALARVQKKANDKVRKVSPGQEAGAGWVWLFTTLPETYSAQEILEMYRYRWQIEMLFKRLKSLFQLGDLRMTKEEHIEAFLFARLWVALLRERIEQTLDVPVFFCPARGYPVGPASGEAFRYHNGFSGHSYGKDFGGSPRLRLIRGNGGSMIRRARDD